MMRFTTLYLATLTHSQSSIILASAGFAKGHPLTSDVQILGHNDLYGHSSTRKGTLLALTTPQAWATAEAACDRMGENLYDVQSRSDPTIKLLANLNNAASTAYEENYFWTARGSSSSCRAASADGHTTQFDCNRTLPALCAQSAPISSSSAEDTNERWQTTVQSGKQTVTGFRDHHVFKFLGVRYASQPARFTYSTVFDKKENASAISFGPSCLQAGCQFPRCSEDCLFLNIWTPYLPRPHSIPDKLKPVMMFIHGSGTAGSGSSPDSDGTNLASRGDVVVVTVNYRLGVYGFLALDDGITNGNYGLRDQNTARNWLHEHIRDFGGDPDRIIVFGQSAGATSTAAMLSSSQTVGKIAGAILLSRFGGGGLSRYWSEWLKPKEAEEVWFNNTLAPTGCQNARSRRDCLAAYNAQALVSLPNPLPTFVIDGEYVTFPAFAVNGQGHTSNVPLMHGVLQDDGAPMGYGPTPNLTLYEYLAVYAPEEAVLAVSSGALPIPDWPNKTMATFDAYSRALTDIFFRCNAYSAAHSAALHKAFKTQYFYEFNRSFQPPGFPSFGGVCEPPVSPEHPFGDPLKDYYKCHSGDLIMVFGNLVRWGYTPRDDLDVPFQQYLIDMFSSFAYSGDPNPKRSLLEAKGYTNTTKVLDMQGPWMPFEEKEQMYRLQPQKGGGMTDLGEAPQCAAVKLGLDYWEKFDWTRKRLSFHKAGFDI